VDLAIDDSVVASMAISPPPVLQVQRLLSVSLTSSEPRQMPRYHTDPQEVPAAQPSRSTKRCGLNL
jgi:hypothetical protein